MKINICPTCATVSLIWLALSVGVVLNLLDSDAFLTPIALLMGSTVVGIAYTAEKKWSWANSHPNLWKALSISGGLILAYFLATNLSPGIVALEALILFLVGYLLFVKKTSVDADRGSRVSDIEKQMENCC